MEEQTVPAVTTPAASSEDAQEKSFALNIEAVKAKRLAAGKNPGPAKPATESAPPQAATEAQQAPEAAPPAKPPAPTPIDRAWASLAKREVAIKAEVASYKEKAAALESEAMQAKRQLAELQDRIKSAPEEVLKAGGSTVEQWLARNLGVPQPAVTTAPADDKVSKLEKALTDIQREIEAQKREAAERPQREAGLKALESYKASGRALVEDPAQAEKYAPILVAAALTGKDVPTLIHERLAEYGKDTGHGIDVAELVEIMRQEYAPVVDRARGLLVPAAAVPPAEPAPKRRSSLTPGLSTGGSPTETWEQHKERVKAQMIARKKSA